MARAATTTDAFNAIAEPRRRGIINVLVRGRAHSVGELVKRLRMPQPVVSKHLGVLRKVGIVSVTKEGRAPGDGTTGSQEPTSSRPGGGPC